MLCEYELQFGVYKKHPAPINDLNTILIELKNYKNLKCDIKNIILIGHSAGAHLIAYWASQNKNEAVKLLVGLEGIYDIPQLAKDWPSYVDWFIKAEFASKKNWQQASPTQLIFKNKTPWLVVHSAKDELVNTKQSTDFAAHLKSQKISVEYLSLLSETHFGVADLLKTSQSVLSQKLLKMIN